MPHRDADSADGQAAAATRADDDAADANAGDGGNTVGRGNGAGGNGDGADAAGENGGGAAGENNDEAARRAMQAAIQVLAAMDPAARDAAIAAAAHGQGGDGGAARKTLLESGGFYTHTKNVWSAVPQNLSTDASHWKRFIRSEASLNFTCIAMSRDKKQRKWYQQTHTHAVEVDSVIVGPSSSRSSPSLLTKEAIWYTDINGNVNNEYVEGANILPAGESDHVDWYNVGGAAVGLGVSASTKEKLRAVQGCKNMLSAQQKRHYHEGVLHLVSNRLYLKCQKQHIDGQRPKMLIVPIRSSDQVVGWKGEGYSAIVLVGEPETDVPLPEDLRVSDDKKKEVYRESRLNRERIADSQDVMQACNLLQDGVLALAEMIKSITNEDLLGISAENKKSAERLRSSRDKIGDTILVPGMINETVPSNCKVLQITFSAQTENEGHPAPDPLLLLFKAANVWGRMIGVHFLANGEIPDVFDTDMHIQAVENYLEWHQSNLKNVSREELARGLGQLSH